MKELSLHILDILRNAVEAGASRVELRIDEDPAADRLTIAVADDGRGMSGETIARVLDPFVTSRTTRHVGLGLPLLAEAARRCEGGLTIESEPGRGTTVRASFRRSHWDRAPLGDIPGALLATLLAEREIDLSYLHKLNGHEFRFDTAEIKKELDGVPISHPMIREWILEALKEGEAELRNNSEL